MAGKSPFTCIRALILAAALLAGCSSSGGWSEEAFNEALGPVPIGGYTGHGWLSGKVVSTFKDWSSASVAVKRLSPVSNANPVFAGKIFSAYSSGQWQSPFSVAISTNFTAPTYKIFIAASGFRPYSSAAVALVMQQSTGIGTITLTPLP